LEALNDTSCFLKKTNLSLDAGNLIITLRRFSNT
jgi:hypothetical protein